MNQTDFLILRDIAETGRTAADTSRLERAGLLHDADGTVSLTQAGLDALQPYKVERAIFMAAGLGSRAVPFTYDEPKGMLPIHGQPMVERLIEQLQAVGINEIWLVTGYLREGYASLAQYGVQFLDNPLYERYNNIGTVHRARQLMDRNLYLLCVDSYLETNIFHQYEYRSWYAAPYMAGPTGEWCMHLDADDRIGGVTIGGADAYVMMGPIYMDATFAQQLAGHIADDYGKPGNDNFYWEDVYLQHLDTMDMYANKQDTVAHEFETLDEFRAFDPTYIDSNSNRHLSAIADALNLPQRDIHATRPLAGGPFARRFSFCAGKRSYLHLYYDDGCPATWPCGAFDETTLPVDGTSLIRLDGRSFVQDATDALSALRILHSRRGKGVASASPLQAYIQDRPSLPPLCEPIANLERAALLSAPQDAMALVHGVFCNANCLTSADGPVLLEDRFAFRTDVLYDVGSYCAIENYAVNEALQLYLQRDPSSEEQRRCHAYAAATAMLLHLWYTEQTKNGIDSLGREHLYAQRAQSHYQQAMG